MKKLLFLTLLCAAFGASLFAQGGPLTPAASSTGSITGNSANCFAGVCVVLHMATSNVGFSVTVSGTWTGTLTIEQSGDNQATWSSVTTTTANTLFTSALTPGITDVRVRGSAAMTGSAVVTITASGPATIQNNIGSGSSSASSFNTNITDVVTFGAKFNGKACFGNVNTITITNGSNQVVCNAAAFTSADIGKQFTASNGCCGITGNYQGTKLFPFVAMHIGSIVNGTTANIVKDSDGTAATAIGGCTGATCIIAWATNDDAAITAAEAVWSAQNKCGAIQMPAGITALLQPHFNNPGTNCLGMEPQADFTAGISGMGIGATVLGLFSGFNFAGCPGNKCFFAFLEMTGSNFQLNGFGIGDTSAPAITSLMAPGLGSQLSQVACNAFGGSDANNMIGFNFNGAGVRIWGVSIDGCGKTGGQVNGFIDKAYYCFFGDTLGPNLQIGGGTDDFTDYGCDYGITGGTQVILVAGRYHGIGSSLFGCGATNSTAITLSNAVNAIVILDGVRFNCASTTSNGIFTAATSQRVVISGGSVIGGTSAAILSSSGGQVYVSPDSQLINGAVTSIAPTCAATTGGTGCSLLGGSTNEKGTVRVTASAVATGTVTLTYNGGNYTGPNGQAPRCTFNYVNAGGTGTWSLTTTTPIVTTSRSTASVVFNWNQTAALTAASTYDIDYSCPAT